MDYIESLNRLLNTEFQVLYHDEMFVEGSPERIVIAPDDMLGSVLEISFIEGDYWDFDLKHNGVVYANQTKSFPSSKDAESIYYQLYCDLKDSIASLLDLNKNSLQQAANRISEYVSLFSQEVVPGFSTVQSAIKIFTNPAVQILVNDREKHTSAWFVKYTISEHLSFQKKYLEISLENIRNILQSDENVIESGPDTTSVSKLNWNGTDTDLLELIVGLLETQSVSISGNKTSRKELIKAFETIFSIEIKDFESKLTRATERKKDTSPYLSKLKLAFDNYCERKIDRQE